MDHNNYNPYSQQNNQYQPGNYNGFYRNPGQTMATVSMILGIISILTLLTVYIPFICGSIAIVLAILSKGSFNKMLASAKIGIGTAIGSMSLVIVMIVSLTSMIMSAGSDTLIKFGQQIDQQFKEQTGQDVEDVFGISYEDLMREYVEN